MMSESMVERVARAICDSVEADNFDELPRDSIHRAVYVQQARAAIEAMREPTAPMLSAARTAPSDLVWRDSLTAQMEADAASKYRAMIDAALNPQTPA